MLLNVLGGSAVSVLGLYPYHLITYFVFLLTLIGMTMPSVGSSPLMRVRFWLVSFSFVLR